MNCACCGEEIASNQRMTEAPGSTRDKAQWAHYECVHGEPFDESKWKGLGPYGDDVDVPFPCPVCGESIPPDAPSFGEAVWHVLGWIHPSCLDILHGADGDEDDPWGFCS